MLVWGGDAPLKKEAVVGNKASRVGGNFPLLEKGALIFLATLLLATLGKQVGTGRQSLMFAQIVYY